MQYSDYDYMYIDTTRGSIRASHQRGYRKDPVILGQNIYSVEPEKSHHVLTHCHLEQSGWSPDGLFEIHSMGTGRDPERTPYLKKRATRFKKWNGSFLLIRNGYSINFSLRRGYNQTFSS